MMKNIYLILVLFLLLGCAVITPTDIESTYVGIYRSVDVVLPEKYLWVNVKTTELTIYFGSQNEKSLPSSAVKISGDTAIAGLDPNYSFQSGTISGSVTFSDRELYITYLANTSTTDIIVLKDVKCVKQE